MTEFFFLTLSPFATKVFATSGGNPPPGSGITLPNPLSCSTVFCLLDKVLVFLFNIAIPITVIMVLVGAFQILTAGGDPAKFTTGRNTILYAAGGFAVVVLANSITAIIRSIF